MVRNKFEKKISDNLPKGTSYESLKLTYVKEHTYTPDFILPNGIIIEVKGRFLPNDRGKHLIIKKTYPELDIRFFFQNPNLTLSKKSKTTYGNWCDKYNIKWTSDLKVLKSWASE